MNSCPNPAVRSRGRQFLWADALAPPESLPTRREREELTRHRHLPHRLLRLIQPAHRQHSHLLQPERMPGPQPVRGPNLHVRGLRDDGVRERGVQQNLKLTLRSAAPQLQRAILPRRTAPQHPVRRPRSHSKLLLARTLTPHPLRNRRAATVAARADFPARELSSCDAVSDRASIYACSGF